MVRELCEYCTEVISSGNKREATKQRVLKSLANFLKGQFNKLVENPGIARVRQRYHSSCVDARLWPRIDYPLQASSTVAVFLAAGLELATSSLKFEVQPK